MHSSQTNTMPEQSVKPKPPEVIRQGWVCPKCGKGVSPNVDVCPCSKLIENMFVQNG